MADAAHESVLAQEVSIQSDTLRAVFRPAAGGRMARLHHADHGDLLIPLGPDPFAPSAWPKAGAFPLFPFHNKLQTGSFRIDGREVRLRSNMADGIGVMHGPSHCRAWRVSGHSKRHIRLTLDYAADEDWPFDFQAQQRFALSGNRLTIALCLINTGSHPMPGGIGWHPYLQPSAEGLIDLHAARQWHPFDQECPSRPVQTTDAAPAIHLATGQTQHYSGWRDVTALIGAGARISLEARDGLTCLAALHKSGYLCLEPVSHVAGALDASGASPFDMGMRRLGPGDSLSGTVVLEVS
mgnify:CR=1 FL=1|jgi:aldose 1-epimerase